MTAAGVVVAMILPRNTEEVANVNSFIFSCYGGGAGVMVHARDGGGGAGVMVHAQ